MTHEASTSSTDPEAPKTPGAAAQYYQRLEMEAEQVKKFLADFPETDDPEPPGQKAGPAEIAKYQAKLKTYIDEMYDIFIDADYKGESLWIEFTTTFRPASIPNFSRAQTSKWTKLLTDGGVYLSRRKRVTQAKALMECLTSEKFIPANTNSENNKANDKNVTNELPNVHPTRKHLIRKEEEHQVSEDHSTTIINHRVNNQDTIRTPQPTNNNKYFNHAQSNFNSNKTHHDNDSLGLHGLFRSYQGRKKFSGNFNDDIQSAFQLYETLSTMCHLSEEEKAQGLPVMLCDDALTYFSALPNQGNSYSMMKDNLMSYYTSEEQKGRVLSNYQSMRLSEAMRNDPEKSELQVFRQFTNKLSRLQQQLDTIYHNDTFLRDQLIISTDIPHVQKLLRERLPRTSQQAINRIATHLSSETNSAGSYLTKDEEEEDITMYTYGHRYGGTAARGRKYNNNRNSRHRSHNKISSSWFKGTKGCYVCGLNHKAHTKHPPEEVRAAIERLKSRDPSALLTVEDLAFVVGEISQNTDENDTETVFSDSEDQAYISEDLLNYHKETEMHLSNTSFSHGRSFFSDRDTAMASMNRELREGETTSFKGIHLDTCANRSSVMSISQYKAYCREFNVPVKLDTSTSRNLSGIGGSRKSLGSVIIPIPFADLNIVIDVKFQIVSDKVPSLLSMKDMKDNGLDISIQNEEISFKHHYQKLTMENYFLIHRWQPSDMDYCLYTEAELRTLHRSFGHPSASALYNLLKRARSEEMNSKVRKSIEEISDSCDICSKNSKRPRRFKLTVGTDDLRFNHTVAMDVMHIAGRALLHVVDEATHFNAALFLRNQSSQCIWKSFLKCWSRVYLGPPDYLHVDQGSNFISVELSKCAQAEGITVVKAPIESPATMTHVERYHAPLRSAFTKIRESLPRSETDEECLQLAVKAVNDTIGPEGLVPTLLVFGAIPRPATVEPAKCQMERARALEKAMDAVTREQAKRRIALGLKSKSPKGVEHSTELRKLPAGAKVYVFRQKTKKWEGPFIFVEIQGETVTVQLPAGRKIFRSSVVKPVVRSTFRETAPYNNNVSRKEQNTTNEQEPNFAFTSFSEQLTHVLYGASKMEVHGKESAHLFSESRKKEWLGLLENGTFKIVKRSNVPKGTRIYGCRFVDSVKTVRGEQFDKSRLVAQNFMDLAALFIATKSPTISKLGQRILFALAACFPELAVYLRDITQAYIQAKSSLERTIYLEPVPEMGLSEDEVILVLKPLYGIPESGLHWFVTYHDHHINTLNMIPSIVDPCVLYRRNGNDLDGMTALQVDDSVGFGSPTFLKDEEKTADKFKSKAQIILEPGKEGTFNGTVVRRNEDLSYTLHQKEKLEALCEVETDEEFKSVRAAIQYIGNSTRPDLCSPSQLLATNSPTPEQKKDLNKLVCYCKETSDTGLNFVRLDLTSVRIAMFTDSSFANADNYKSQLGFVLLLVDDSNNCNLIHYGSTRCKRVTRSVMAAEIHALMYGFDRAFITKTILEEILGRTIEIDGYVDSKTLLDVVAKSAATLEKRLQIDVHALRESHEKGELRQLSHIPGFQNYSDALTKGIISKLHSIWNLLKSNKLDIDIEGWARKGNENKN